MWVATHMYMEATLGISLYSYLSQTSQKYYVFLIISYVFSSTKSGWNRFCPEAEVVVVVLRGVGLSNVYKYE
jgi:asparagine N-glycosylation enzyme membrane subunit Stt3